jgi:acetyltransferase-like isoleucine patch superfamily enzyme
VIVGPGVTIGDGAVVGANSVVLDDIPPWSIAAGSPARVLGKRDRDERAESAIEKADKRETGSKP